MSTPKRNNQIELEENPLGQEQYISPEKQKYYDTFFEDPEKAIQSNGTKSNSKQITNKKGKKSIKEGEDIYFKKEM